VSRNNRLIERHETSHGAYWKSYDFSDNTGAQNIFERPLGPGNDERSFRHAGGEIIFNLPNGLQGYLLVNAQGKRLDKAPTDIVSDPRRPDRAVENGLSCMACHARGIQFKDDQVRAHVEKNRGAFPNDEVDTILTLYPPAATFRQLLKEDAERFERAARATGAHAGRTEPILALASQYEAALDARRAAAEVDLPGNEFLARLERSPGLQRSLGPLQIPGGTIPREVFDSVFAELVGEYKLGTPGTTPGDLIASAGFNDARGMNSKPGPGSPYPLDTPNREGGAGEPGWVGPWEAHPRATYQSKVVFEGDGALFLQGSPNVGPNYSRQWTKAQTGRFQVEFYLQVPGGSHLGGYVWQHPLGADVSGPTWNVSNGKFIAQNKDTGFKCVPGQWYKVTLRIDGEKETWEFFVDDKRFESPQPLKFRGKVAYLDAINFLIEGGVYLDALRVTELPGGERKKSE
jgi:hypothetical protein